MNKFKKGLILVLAIGVLMMGSVFGAMATATETAKFNITTFIGENTTNTGIRIVEGYTTLPVGNQTEKTAFDSAFFGATSVITVNNTTKDNSIEEVEGYFGVLVRRVVSATGSITVNLTASPLVNGTNFLPYTLTFENGNATATAKTLNITSTSQTGVYNIANGSANSLIRHQNIFKYSIPVNTNAPFGTYSGDIVFTITMP